MNKIIYVANWDWVIHNFRLALAHAARDAGYEVVLVCPAGKYVRKFEEAEFRWVEWSLDRKSLNPVGEVQSVLSLARIYEDEQPDLIHHDTIKPNVYGSLATWINQLRGVRDQPPQLINSFMGIGFLFSERLLARILRSFVLPIMRFGMRRSHIFTTFSNEKDRVTFVQRDLVQSERTRVMVSEFANTGRFQPRPNGKTGQDKLVVLMAARLLWDKGVQEFVTAAQALSETGTPVEFWLAGEPDTETPGFVPKEQLKKWDQKRFINWLGYRTDMPKLLKRADVAALPTFYNEGLPRFLVEAAATGLPLISTDLEACQRIVDDGRNGFVIPKQDPEQLANAVEKLVRNPSLRKTMGEASREKVLDEFAEREVVEEWLDLYDELLVEAK
jgi:glycosyltransferase involved in cell wall biosynthesis